MLIWIIDNIFMFLSNLNSWYINMTIMVIIFVMVMRKTTRLKSGGGIWPNKSPLSTARVLIDAVGYVCSESMKCDDCLPQTLGDELTLSLAVTLNQD